MENMDKYVADVKKAITDTGIEKFRVIRNGNILTVYITCTRNFYERQLLAVLITYGAVTQIMEEVDDTPGEGQLWRYTILFINR